MNGKSRLASYVPKGKGEAGYEAAKGDVNRPDRHRLTVIVTALVTRKDLCEVRIRTGQTEVAVFYSLRT